MSRKFCTLPDNTRCQCDPEYSDCPRIHRERVERSGDAAPVPMYERGD